MPAPRPGPEEVFHRSRLIDVPAERDAYLRGACGDDLALLSKVEALLQADAEAGSFLVSGDKGADSPGASLPHEQVGTMIGRYKLLQEIGIGGFGVVYLAEQRKPMRRKVALKVIKLGMDTRQVIARFEAERQALAMMEHPNIAKVLDAGATDSGRPYFVMELVKGVPITDYCDSNNLTVRERLDLFTDVCGAVQHAHQKGIVHRDIKPSNVLVTLHDGVPVPKVIDFGIAKATSAELTEKTLFTEHGQMIGTPVYMSPEQAEMSGLDIDTRSDIYSLGVLLYELLTGTTPFTVEDLRAAGFAEMQRVIREQEPPKPSTRLSTLDALPSIAAHRGIEPRKLGQLMRGDLDWIIMKALEKDRMRRYETANAFAADVLRHVNDEPVVASPPSSAYRVRKFVRRNRRGVVAAGVLAVVLVAGITGTTRGLIMERAARQDAAEQRLVAVQSANLATERAEELGLANQQLAETNARLASETDRAERRAYSASLLAAKAQLEAGHIGDAQRLHALCPEPFRNWEWHHLGLSLDQSLLTLEGHDGPAASVDWSPDGTRVVSGSIDGTLRIWDAASGDSLHILKGHAGRVGVVAWSPDGTRIVSGSWDDGTLGIWDAASGDSLETLEGHDGGVNSVAWSPDGTRIVAGGRSSADKTVRIWSATSGERLRTLEGPGLSGLTSVAWSPDGTRIVSGSFDKLHIWDVASGESLLILHRHPYQVLSVAWSPDGTLIASSGGDDTVRIWDVASGENVQTLVWHEISMDSVAWSPDGTRIVAVGAGEDDTLPIWDVTSGEILQILRGHGEGVMSVAWSSDGTRIVSGALDNTVRIWDAASGDSLQSLEGNGDRVYSGAWSPDGKAMSSVWSDGRLRILDAVSGESRQTVKAQGPVAWSPDASRIVSWSDDATLQILDTASGVILGSLDGKGGWMKPVAWSPDGARIVSQLQDKAMRVWDAASGEVLLTLEGQGGRMSSVAWSPDGTRIIAGSHDNTLHLWEAKGGESLRTLEGHENWVSCVAWSPDGKRVVSGSNDRTLRIWDAASGESLLTLEGHGDMVNCVGWSPDETRIVSGSDDKTLRIWDADSGDSLLTMEGHGDGVNSVAWSPDGMRILSSGGNDKGLRIWESRLADALPLWRVEDRRQRVRPLVNTLFEEHIFLELVLTSLRTEHSLPDDLRDVALRMARSRGNPSASGLNSRAWPLVDPEREDEQTDVVLGLRLARAAVELAPDDHEIRDTLAWALLANGFYDEALAQSEQALQLAPEEAKGEYQGHFDRMRKVVSDARQEH